MFSLFRSIVFVFLAAFICAVPLNAQYPIITVVGTPWNISLTKGRALSTPLGQVQGVRTDAAGNLYICDPSNNVVVKVTPDGTLIPIAGNGRPGFSGDGGPAVNAQLNSPSAVASDNAGNIYIADTNNVRIRKVDSSGIITTFAGSGPASAGGARSTGDGGPATAATLLPPYAVAVDPAGNLFISELYGIRRVDTNGIVSAYPVCTDSSACSVYDGAAIFGLLVAPNGDLYLTETNFARPERVRKVTPSGQVITVAGNGTLGFSGDGGPALQAMLNGPMDIALDSAGNLFIADNNNLRIRRVDTHGIISTVAGNGGDLSSPDGIPAISASLRHPSSLAIGPNGDLFISETDSMRVRHIDTPGILTTIAGNGQYHYGGDNGPAVSAFLNNPQKIVLDSQDNLYIADAGNQRVRKVDRAGIITTVAGNGNKGFSGDGGRATDASLNNPIGIAVDSKGNLYIADSLNYRVRRVSTDGMITTVSGNGVNATSGDGGPAAAASLFSLADVTVDSSGNIYVLQGSIFAAPSAASSKDARVRRIDSSGTISTVAGGGTQPAQTGQNVPATSVTFGDLTRLAVDRSGNLYTGELSTGNLYKITASGILNIIANFSSQGFCFAFCLPSGPIDLVMGNSGEIYVVTFGGSVFRISSTGDKTPIPIPPARSLAVDKSGNLLLLGDGDVAQKALIACGTSPEPLTTVNLQPGFYIAEVRNLAGTPGGFWGMEVQGQFGSLAGGFDLGGGTFNAGGLTSFGAFDFPSGGTVHIKVNAEAVAGGAVPSMALRLLNANYQPVVPDYMIGSSAEFDTPPLDPGFYVIGVLTPQDAPRAMYQMQINAPAIGGVADAGGYVTDGMVGFGAFYISQTQDVTIKLFGTSAYGTAAAVCPVLTLRDSSMQVIQTAP